jgi:hypothetical protein
MRRTEIELDDALHARLTALARRQRRSLSEPVREALAKAYGANREDERRSSLKAIAGLWKDRCDLPATGAYVRRLLGSPNFAALGFPGGDLVDIGLADLAGGRVTVETLLVSVAAPRLHREGVPLGPDHEDPEDRLSRVSSFADACRPPHSLTRGQPGGTMCV